MKARCRKPYLPVRAMAQPPVRKEDAPCCQARALPDGRPPIGYCSPGCLRRPRKDA